MMPKQQSEAVLGFSRCPLIILETADFGYHGAPEPDLSLRIDFMLAFK